MREALNRFSKEVMAQAEYAVKRGNEEKGLIAKAVLLGRAQAFDFVIKQMNKELTEVIRRENEYAYQALKVRGTQNSR